MLPAYPQEFVNFLMAEQERGRDPTLEDRRATSINFYDGRPYGDEVEGRSQAVTRDVAEVIDTQQVGILNTILASGKAVEFESESEQQTDENGQPAMQPVMGPDGQPAMDDQGQPIMRPVMVDYGEEATAAVRYQFLRKQPGYRVLHDVLKAGQMEMTGIVKTYAEPQPDKREERRLLADELVEHDEYGLMTADGLRVVSADPIVDGDELIYDAVVLVPQPPAFCDRPVPNEFFRVAPDATSLDEAIYVGERMRKTIGDLVKLGYDPDVLGPLIGNGNANTVLEHARDANRSQTAYSVGQRDGANRLVWLEEEYPLYDLNGDGIAERLFVHRVGNVVLKVMEVDEQPYSLWSPFPRQHRLVGDSTADKTMDIQRIRSVLLRQGLDSQYLANSPRTVVSEDSMTVDTIDDLLTVRAGGLIRHRGSMPPQPFQQQDTSQNAFNGMEMMSAERESRTGVTRQSQGLNPDTMNKTAAGMGMLMAQSQQIEQYVTRNFAEFIVAPMFAKRYRLMRRYGQPFRMKIEGKYRTVDPRRWPEDIDMNINVGLGTGNKDQKLTFRTALLQFQRECMMGGLPIVTPQHIYENLRGYVQDSGVGVPSDFVANPADLPPQPEQPNPEVVKAQTEAQVQAAKDQQAHQQAMSKLELQAQQMDAENALKARQQEFSLSAEREKAALDTELKQRRAELEAALAQRQQDFEMDLAERRFAFDQKMARAKQEQADESDDNISSYRPGGDLDQ